MRKKLLSILLIIFMMSTMIMTGCKSSSSEVADASSFPKDTVTIIVPWGVGGGVDVIARKVAQIGEKYLGKPIIVENHTGAAGTIAVGDLLDAKADGYTMAVLNGPLFSLTPNYVDVDYTIDDVTPLKGMRTVPLVMLTNPNKSNIKSFEDLVEYGKNNKIKYGTSGGPGGDQYTMLAYIFKSLGIDAEAVVYDGQGEAINAIVGGHVDMAIATPPTYYEHEDAGTIKAIATLTPENIETKFGTVKSVKEMGVDAEYLGMDYFAVNSKVPEEIKEKLLEVLNKTYQDPEFISYMEELQYPIWDVNGNDILSEIDNQTTAIEKYIKLIE